MTVKIVGYGVDTLVVNVYPTDNRFQIEKRRIDEELQEELQMLKEKAQEEEENIPTRFVYQGTPLLMQAKGGDGFNWIMRNNSISVAVNRGSKAQLLAQVRVSSEMLWRYRDLGEVVPSVHQFLMSIFGEYILLQVSSVDLAVDVVGLELGSITDIMNRFVSRAQLGDYRLADDEIILGPDAIKTRWKRVTGLPFGARGGALSALIYDKTHEIKYKSPEKSWFYEIWKEAGWNEEEQVWRVEVRFKRAALNEMKGDDWHGINDAYDLLDKLPGLWAYAVGAEDGQGWLRMVTPTEDTNRARWPVTEEWRVIQGAFTPADATPVDLGPLQREKKRQVNVRRLVAQIAGCSITLEAWRGEREVEVDISDTFHYLFNEVERYLEEKERDFTEHVKKKRLIYSIQGCEAV